MGRHLDALTQRYLDSGDFSAFRLGFDAALREDALQARITPAQIRAFSLAVAGDYTGYRTFLERMAADETEPTPEELLVALEPPKPEARPKPLTWYTAWDNFKGNLWHEVGLFFQGISTWIQAHPLTFLSLCILWLIIVGLLLVQVK